MLLNLSFDDHHIYFWGLTDQIKKDTPIPFIDSPLSILKTIAIKNAFKAKFASGPKDIELFLPTKDDMVDVTGKSTDFKKYQTKAYRVSLYGFQAFAPSRLKKEFPKKAFTNIHFSNSLTLVHLLMRIISELFDARSYYPHIYVENNEIHTSWKACLNEGVRYYIEQITQELPESFFIFKPEERTHFEFIRDMLDKAIQVMMAHTQIVDDRALRKLPKLHNEIIRNLVTESPKPIPISEEFDTDELESIIIQHMNLFTDTATIFPNIEFKSEGDHFFKCSVTPMDAFTKEEVTNPSEQLCNYEIFDGQKALLLQELKDIQQVDLQSMAPVLEKLKEIQIQTGVNVVLPKGITHIPVAAKAEVFIETAELEEEGGLFSPASIANVKWNILLGDQPVTLDELQKLADEKQTHYVKGDILIPVDPDQLHNFLKHVKKIQKNKLTPFDLLRADVGYGINYNLTSGWLQRVFNQLKGQVPIKDMPQPKGLNAILRPYQVRGYSWLCFMRQSGLGACLADDMGLGKTIQTIAYMLSVRSNEPKKSPFLLICPTSLLSNWKRELSVFAPTLKTHIHHGALRDKETELDMDVIITSYSLIDRDIAFLKEIVWDAIILDEAQNIKNPDAKQTKAIKSLRTRHRIILTGTPIENRPTDIWSLIDFLNHGLLGNKTWFHSNYGKALSYSAKKEQQESSQKIAQQLKLIVGPFMLRRLKTDKSIIVDLPDRINHKIVCSLSLEQTSLYKAYVDKMLKEFETADGLQRRGLILSTLMRLKQICNHPSLLTKEPGGESGKMDVLHDLIDDILESNEKALIFTQFKEMGDLLLASLKKRGVKPLFLNGSTPAKDRGKMVETFQENPDCKVFILSLKAGGTGLNLTAASHVIHYDRWWNPAVEDQATSRAHRIGQENVVSVHTFICHGTIEDRIDTMLAQKIALAEQVVGEGEGWITELTDSQLKDLLTLKDAA